MDNLLGKRLDGRYQITELIGTGGMANVYKAADLLENRTVAVKVLREEFLDNEELVRRFKNESKAISLLSHPNIVKVLDVNFSDAIQYIVMEFIDGITLKQYIDSAKPLGWKDTIHFIEQILRALQHAHDRGIVHRDIKPQNIMLLADGSIKVMDFGIARFSRSETRTITDKAIGSVHYISPEQAKGDITDSKADIYSAGIMMYEMLTGRLPFESDTPVQVAIKQISDEATRPREIVEDIPEGLEEITLKAMTKNAAQRYQSAAQMLRDIDDFKKNPSIVFQYKYFSDNAATKYIGQSTDSLKSAMRKTQSKDPGAAVHKRKKKAQKRARISVYLASGIAAACLVCTLVLVLFMTGTFEGRQENVTLPDFTGKTYEEIRNNPDYKNFDITKPIEEYTKEPDKFPIGTVIKQSPVGGKEVKENSRVTLTVSKGGEEVQLPDVVGLSSGDAQKILKGAGFKVSRDKKADSNYTANVVLEMNPAAGNLVMVGETVTIYVNVMGGGDESVKVPDLSGRSLADAYTELDNAGLTPGETNTVPSAEPKGTVVGQNPKAGAPVPHGTRVAIEVSGGPAEQTYSGINFVAPVPPGGYSSYTISIRIGGVAHQSRQMSNTGAVVIDTFTVRAETTVEVYLVVGSNEYLYLTFKASNTKSECVLVSGTPQTTWPASFVVPPPVAPPAPAPGAAATPLAGRRRKNG